MCPYYRGVLISEGGMYRLQWSWEHATNNNLYETCSKECIAINAHITFQDGTHLDLPILTPFVVCIE